MHYEGKLKLNNKKLKLTSKQISFDNCARYEVMNYTMSVIVVPVV